MSRNASFVEISLCFAIETSSGIFCDEEKQQIRFSDNIVIFIEIRNSCIIRQFYYFGIFEVNRVPFRALKKIVYHFLFISAVSHVIEKNPIFEVFWFIEILDLNFVSSDLEHSISPDRRQLHLIPYNLIIIRINIKHLILLSTDLVIEPFDLSKSNFWSLYSKLTNIVHYFIIRFLNIQHSGSFKQLRHQINIIFHHISLIILSILDSLYHCL